MAVFDDLPEELQREIAKSAVLDSSSSSIFDIKDNVLVKNTKPSSEAFTTLVSLSKTNKTLRKIAVEVLCHCLSVLYDLRKQRTKWLPLMYTSFLAARKRHLELDLPPLPRARNYTRPSRKTTKRFATARENLEGEAKEVYTAHFRRTVMAQILRKHVMNLHYEVGVQLYPLLVTLDIKVYFEPDRRSQ